MQVEVKIDPACANPKVVVWTDKMTDEVAALLNRLTESAPPGLAGNRQGEWETLEQSRIIRLFVRETRTIAVTVDGEYTLRAELDELEKSLDPARFVRISRSEIISLTGIKSFDLSPGGAIGVQLTNGATARVSRRYVAKIKRALGV